jgi:hypothetical protein
MQTLCHLLPLFQGDSYLPHPPNSPFLLPPPVWNQRVSRNSGRSTTGLLREFVCKYRRTKDLEVKIHETKELRADFLLGLFASSWMHCLCWGDYQTGLRCGTRLGVTTGLWISLRFWAALPGLAKPVSPRGTRSECTLVRTKSISQPCRVVAL